ncbi:MAG: type IV toxin-antitoxin system AbiEi family antitoxin domain-containing protein [Nocardioides sp.]
MDQRTRALLAEQDGVIARRQLLELGVGVNDLARFVRRRELARVHPGVFCDHTGPLTWHRRAWAAVLYCGRSALSHQSALRAAEGPGRRGERGDEPIAVAVDRQRKVVAPAGVRVHRMAGLEQRVLWNLGPPRVRYEDAAIDVALAEPTDFDALAVLAAACSRDGRRLGACEPRWTPASGWRGGPG